MVINAGKKDVIWNYLGIFFSLGSNVIFLPVMIHYVSPDMVGLWYIFASIGAIVQLFDMGFNPTISHSVTYAWSGASDLKKDGVAFTDENGGPNIPLLCGVLRACRYLYLRISLAAAFAMFMFGTLYLRNVAASYMTWDVYASWFIYIISIFTNMYIGYYAVVLTGIGDVFRKNKATIISRGLFVFLGIIGLVLGYGLLCLCVSYLLSGFALRYLCKKYLLVNHSFGHFMNSGDEGKYSVRYVIGTMWHNAWRDGLVTITAYLTGQATVLISGAYLSLYETGIYSVSMQIINVLLGVAGGLFGAYVPALQSYYVTKNVEKAKILYQRAISCFYFITVLGVIGFLVVGIPIIQFIRHDFIINRLHFTELTVSMFLMARHRWAACLISTWNTLPYTFAFIVFGILSVIATYIGLAFLNLGIVGLICIPLAVESFYNNWKWVVVVNRFYNISELDILRFGMKECKKLVKSYFRNHQLNA